MAIMLAVEATQDLAVRPTTVQTPLTEATGYHLMERIGLVPIPRSGLGMVEGVWELMPGAEVWHIGLYRDERTLNQSHTTIACPLNRPSLFASSLTRCWPRAAQPAPQSTF